MTGSGRLSPLLTAKNREQEGAANGSFVPEGARSAAAKQQSIAPNRSFAQFAKRTGISAKSDVS
jgi:hypothetical protein